MVFFFFKKNFCFSAGVDKLFAKCLLSIKALSGSLLKNDISGYIYTNHRIVKYSFLDERTVYRSFYGRALSCWYFNFLQGKPVCLFACFAKCLFSEGFCDNLDIWLQLVKTFFLFFVVMKKIWMKRFVVKC